MKRAPAQARVIPCSVCGRPAYRETDRERQPGHYTQLRCACRSRRLRILDTYPQGD